MAREVINAPPEWRNAVLTNLERSGPVCKHAAHYIAQNEVEIGFAKQSTGARWTLAGNIELNPIYHPPGMNPADVRLLGAVVHEAIHLDQGRVLALSVEGEVGGWKAEFDARAELGAPITNAHWRAVAQTPVPPTNADLRKARREMVRMAGPRYLIWLLPLRPLRPLRLVLGR